MSTAAAPSYPSHVWYLSACSLCFCFLVASADQAPAPPLYLVEILGSSFPLPIMADGAANVEQGRQRRRARAAADGERSVRQRLGDMETRMDTAEALCRAQDTRILYLEAYTKVVLRGFSPVGRIKSATSS